MTVAERTFDQSRRMLERYERVVPGAAHTYARGHDQYPAGMAPFIAHGHGARVWDVDGNEYLEYGSGLRAVTLGHAHPRLVAAAATAMASGGAFVRPSVLEVEVAEEFLDAFPGLDMVKFAKNGSDVTTAAVRLARAATGRETVVICADQPFFSTDDWFIGTTAMPAGVPQSARAGTLGFRFNDLPSLERALVEAPGERPASSSRPPEPSSPTPASSPAYVGCATASAPSWCSTR